MSDMKHHLAALLRVLGVEELAVTFKVRATSTGGAVTEHGVGDVPEPVGDGRSLSPAEREAAILRILADNAEHTKSELLRRIGHPNLNGALQRLKDAGRVKSPMRGRWQLA